MEGMTEPWETTPFMGKPYQNASRPGIDSSGYTVLKRTSLQTFKQTERLGVE